MGDESIDEETKTIGRQITDKKNQVHRKRMSGIGIKRCDCKRKVENYVSGVYSPISPAFTLDLLILAFRFYPAKITSLYNFLLPSCQSSVRVGIHDIDKDDVADTHPIQYNMIINNI